MQTSLEFHHDTEPLWQLYGRALRKARSTPERLSPAQVPLLEANLYGAASDPAKLGRYISLCGFDSALSYPVTWPHVLAFPLQLRLLADPGLPLSLLGMVHLHNRIVQHRAIGAGENLDLRCRLANPALGNRGLTFDLCTDVYSGGKRVWEEISTTLVRHPTGATTSPRPAKPSSSAGRHLQALPRYAKSQMLNVPEAVGRRYGILSGDLNPIHLHALSARAFGFPRAIAHGMWSKARCLALLQRQPEWRNGPVEIEVSFKTPLPLPGKATFNWQTRGDQVDFQLLDGKAQAPHLSGFARWRR